MEIITNLELMVKMFGFCSECESIGEIVQARNIETDEIVWVCLACLTDSKYEECCDIKNQNNLHENDENQDENYD